MHVRTLFKLKMYQVRIVTVVLIFFTPCFSKLLSFNSTMGLGPMFLIPARLGQSIAKEIRRMKELEHRRRLHETSNEGTICHLPKLDPFLPDIMKYDVRSPAFVSCPGTDYVKCYHSKCRVVHEEQVKGQSDFLCTYRDIIFDGDYTQHTGRKTVIKGFGEYTLHASDHVAIRCKITDKLSKKVTWWKGFGWGVRNSFKIPDVPKGRENAINVVMVGFDTVSHNHFIRKMPKSFNYLKNELGATFLNGYNIVGDGTTAALIPLLSGRAERELPEDVKRRRAYINHKTFIFYRIKKYGYRTSYFEDLPWVGTFQWKFNGFRVQLADHYGRAFYLAFLESGGFRMSPKICVGGTPSNKLLLNVTDQLLHTEGKHFLFTFIGDVSHDDYNMLGVADENLAEFLSGVHADGYLNNTLLIVFGDHGPRYHVLRNSYAGRIEERLPFMAIRLPETLRQRRPEAQAALQSNIDALTTPFDVHTTILDAMDLRELWNPYKVSGARQRRGLTLLDKIPPTRSCREADISPHWCICQNWVKVPQSDPIYERVGKAFADAVNNFTEIQRPICASRELESIDWVIQQGSNRSRYVNYQVKLTLKPKKAKYEATLTYNTKLDNFFSDFNQISRTNA